ncbi:hypothetical protein HWV62_37853 [Athelia sp. TMB]|nr:hypothetical protein HWV62_37853 [Athelia sp. TMB]
MGQAPDGDARRVGQAVRDGRAREHRAGDPEHPVQGRARAGGDGGAAARAVQVPRAPKDHRVEEVGLHEREQGGVPEAQGGQDGDPVSALPVFAGFSADYGDRDGAYVQFIRPKGNLEQNLRTQLRA